MSENTTIEWCDASINFWHGCTKVSAGCKNCYAETWDARKLYDKEKHFGKGVPRLNMLESARKQAEKLNRKAAKTGKRLRVFTNSMGDWLDDEVPSSWLYELLDVIQGTPNLDWLLLTKRPENFQQRLRESMNNISDKVDDWIDAWLDGHAPANVWLGTSVENQDTADGRIPQLLDIPAKVRFLSCEPLLGPVDLSFIPQGPGHASVNPLLGRRYHHDDNDQWTPTEKVHWVIVGGESGRRARPMLIDWATLLLDQCQLAKVPFFFKQWGEHDESGQRVGKGKAGRLLDGEEWNQFPAWKGGPHE